MKIPKKKIITYSILLILAVLLIVYLIIPATNAIIGRISILKYSPNEGVWVSTDHSAYIDMNVLGWDKGKIRIDDKLYHVEVRCAPTNPVAIVYVESEYYPIDTEKGIVYVESEQYPIDEKEGLVAYWDIKYKKDHFTITVTESNFMKAGTKLTFYRAENDTLPQDFLGG